MNTNLLELLRCPRTGSRLTLVDSKLEDGQIKEGLLVSEGGMNRYPVRGFIPRFVPESNYADNFGIQWNLFRQTQLDSYSGHPISAERFWKATGWVPRSLSGQWVLDCGCGAGRFAEVALSAGAQVIALDYSSAVEACYANLRQHPNLHVVQGDIYALPFGKGSFPFVYSLGVLQHTPDVGKAVLSLPPMLSAGGRLSIDFYENTWKSKLLPKFWLRPMTKRMSSAKLFELLQRLVPVLFSISVRLGRVPKVGSLLHRVVPVANYKGILPLSDEQLREWALLDTFDWLAPEFDNPQTAAAVRGWLQQAGLKEVEVLNAGHLAGRGRAP